MSITYNRVTVNMEVIMLQPIKRNEPSPMKMGAKFPTSKNQPVPEESLSAFHYSHDKVTLSYTNENGERIDFSYEHEDYAQIDINQYSVQDKEKWKKIVESIKDEFEKFKLEAIHDLLSGNADNDKKVEPISLEELNKKTDELIEKMPEEWRPDAVSDRIFAFVTSYFGSTESQGEDFYKLAKNSIIEGFKQAGQEMGKVTDEVNNVVKRTFDQLMEKLDKWAEEQGILPKDDETPQQKPTIDPETGIDISA